MPKLVCESLVMRREDEIQEDLPSCFKFVWIQTSRLCGRDLTLTSEVQTERNVPKSVISCLFRKRSELTYKFDAAKSIVSPKLLSYEDPPNVTFKRSKQTSVDGLPLYTLGVCKKSDFMNLEACCDNIEDRLKSKITVTLIIDPISPLLKLYPHSIPKNASAFTTQIDKRCIYKADSVYGHKDNTQLTYLNAPNLLNNVKMRYARFWTGYWDGGDFEQLANIYTMTGWLLIAVNPMVEIPIYSPSHMKQFGGKSITSNIPHPFAIAENAHHRLLAETKSQSIVVSGESGAGKTETSKHVLKYLARASAEDKNVEVENKRVSGFLAESLLETNPILEAFGNAKTLRNWNSSRFGKLLKLEYGGERYIINASIKTYLFAKARVVHVPSGERNYHIFYSLCETLSLSPIRETFKDVIDLHKPLASQFTYLLTSENILEPAPPISFDIPNLSKAFRSVGINAESEAQIFQALTAILFLGNIQFKTCPLNPDGSTVLNPAVCSVAANLLGIKDTAMLQRSLTSKKICETRGALSPTQAYQARDTLAKHLYALIFEFIVRSMNHFMNPDQHPISLDASYIGILDIFGFENLEPRSRNGFEQFCINFANEKLHGFLINQLIKREALICRKEGIPVAETREEVGNEDICTFISGSKRGVGIIQILDEVSSLPVQGNRDHRFCEKIHKNIIFNRHVLEIQRTPLCQSFTLHHFAEPVTYHSADFVAKNTDSMSDELTNLLQTCGEFVTEKLLQESVKLRCKSLGSDFNDKVNKLLEDLSETSSHFIRCIKPSDDNKQGVFDCVHVSQQLTSSGMVGTLEVMRRGYPCRVPYTQIFDKYKCMLPSHMMSMSTRDFTQLVLEYKSIISSDDYKLGVTQVFFRFGILETIEDLQRSRDMNEEKEMIRELTHHWYLKRKFRIFAALKCGVRLLLAFRKKRAKTISSQCQCTLENIYLPRWQHAASIIIQSQFRRYIYQTVYKETYSAIVSVQKVWRHYIFLKVRTEASEKIQASYRRYAQRKATKLHLLKTLCAVEIQTAFRAYQARQILFLLKLRHRSAVKLQAFFRMRLARQSFLNCLNALPKLKQFCKHVVRVRQNRRLKATIKIQTEQRRCVAERRYKVMKKAVRCIERIVVARKCYVSFVENIGRLAELKKELDEEKRVASILIQKMTRGWMLRKLYLKKRNSAIKIAAHWRSWSLNFFWSFTRCQILHLQRFCRRSDVKRKLRLMRFRRTRASLVIQKYFRRFELLNSQEARKITNTQPLEQVVRCNDLSYEEKHFTLTSDSIDGLQSANYKVARSSQKKSLFNDDDDHSDHQKSTIENSVFNVRTINFEENEEEKEKQFCSLQNCNEEKFIISKKDSTKKLTRTSSNASASEVTILADKKEGKLQTNLVLKSGKSKGRHSSSSYCQYGEQKIDYCSGRRQSCISKLHCADTKKLDFSSCIEQNKNEHHNTDMTDYHNNNNNNNNNNDNNNNDNYDDNNNDDNNDNNDNDNYDDNNNNDNNDNDDYNNNNHDNSNNAKNNGDNTKNCEINSNEHDSNDGIKNVYDNIVMENNDSKNLSKNEEIIDCTIIKHDGNLKRKSTTGCDLVGEPNRKKIQQEVPDFTVFQLSPAKKPRRISLTPRKPEVDHSDSEVLSRSSITKVTENSITDYYHSPLKGDEDKFYGNCKQKEATSSSALSSSSSSYNNILNQCDSIYEHVKEHVTPIFNTRRNSCGIVTSQSPSCSNSPLIQKFTPCQPQSSPILTRRRKNVNKNIKLNVTHSQTSTTNGQILEKYRDNDEPQKKHDPSTLSSPFTSITQTYLTKDIPHFMSPTIIPNNNNITSYNTDYSLDEEEPLLNENSMITTTLSRSSNSNETLPSYLSSIPKPKKIDSNFSSIPKPRRTDHRNDVSHSLLPKFASKKSIVTPGDENVFHTRLVKSTRNSQLITPVVRGDSDSLIPKIARVKSKPRC